MSGRVERVSALQVRAVRRSGFGCERCAHLLRREAFRVRMIVYQTADAAKAAREARELVATMRGLFRARCGA